MTDTDRLRELLAKATPGDLSTAERHVTEKYIECPVCSGDGEVLAADYCNIDDKALGVLFYGIGDEFGAHEALWSALVNAAPALLDELDRLRAELAEARKELTQADLIDIEPVAYRYGFDGYGWQYIDNGSGSDWAIRHPDGEPLYAHPPAARMEERAAIVAWLRHRLDDWPDYVAPSDIATAIEAGEHLK